MESLEDCPRYVAGIVDNIEIKEILAGSCHGIIPVKGGFAISHQEEGIIILNNDLICNLSITTNKF